MFTEILPLASPWGSQGTLMSRRGKISVTPRYRTVREGVKYRGIRLHRTIKRAQVLQRSPTPRHACSPIQAGFSVPHNMTFCTLRSENAWQEKVQLPFCRSLPHEVTRYQTQGRMHWWFNHEIPWKFLTPNFTLKILTWIYDILSATQL